MFKSTVLDVKESKKIVGGKQGPYGECVWISGSGVPGEWYRVDGTNKNGTAKRCDEK